MKAIRITGLLLIVAATSLGRPVICLADTGDSTDAWLADWQQRCVKFFWEQADPQTGLIADRARADGADKFEVASIASVGFGLAALCVADERGWLDHDEVYQRVLTTLRYVDQKLPNIHGFYYHFINIHTGERMWNSELSSIDTTLMIAGIMVARQHFKGTEVDDLAKRIYERADWNWMRNGGDTVSMGWKPGSGFLDARWNSYCELMVLYILGLGSQTHPLPAKAWDAWNRGNSVMTYEGMTFMSEPVLFTHQYSHAFVDFRGLRDDYADYWYNSVLATKAHRLFCMHEASKNYPLYSANLWGITASDTSIGYRGAGGPPADNVMGQVVPCAAAGSIPFLPDECLQTLQYQYKTYGQQAWKYYGFVDAYNPSTGWYDPDVIGIDVGITVLMIENYRSGLIWKLFMANPEIQRAMDRAKFRHNPDADMPVDQRPPKSIYFDHPQAAAPELTDYQALRSWSQDESQQ